MTNDDMMTTLFDVATNAVLRAGSWANSPTFVWTHFDGTPGDHVAPWQAATLVTLLRRGLIAVDPQDDPTRYAAVRLTDRGVAMLYSTAELPLAA
ncbi:hypothetical protein JOD54_004437 [Actinokineospora baliensis]|uniref:hypothetical protein n=1 Tax=Actinokineospora baliensis TaxID=547056 RepID=UPI00195719D1|nr:hypothetical protein [Actinokineospora baliensis]MBM7774233.1 hypothetical protein [Actinokineospora baliensis]